VLSVIIYTEAQRANGCYALLSTGQAFAENEKAPRGATTQHAATEVLPARLAGFLLSRTTACVAHANRMSGHDEVVDRVVRGAFAQQILEAAGAELSELLSGHFHVSIQEG
jgi:hypothetical protein